MGQWVGCKVCEGMMLESSSPLLWEDMREIAYMGGFHGWNPVSDELEEED